MTDFAREAQRYDPQDLDTFEWYVGAIAAIDMPDDLRSAQSTAVSGFRAFLADVDDAGGGERGMRAVLNQSDAEARMRRIFGALGEVERAAQQCPGYAEFVTPM